MELLYMFSHSGCLPNILHSSVKGLAYSFFKYYNVNNSVPELRLALNLKLGTRVRFPRKGLTTWRVLMGTVMKFRVP